MRQSQCNHHKVKMIDVFGPLRSSSRWTWMTAMAAKFSRGDRQIASGFVVSPDAPNSVHATRSS